MPRYFTLSVLLLALIAAPAFAENKSSGDNTAARGGLVCFSITPPKDSVGRQSCDELCAGEDAACFSLEMNGSRNPGIGCADKVDGVVVAGCRCCALQHH